LAASIDDTASSPAAAQPVKPPHSLTGKKPCWSHW
jgi:hypothetical protein